MHTKHLLTWMLAGVVIMSVGLAESADLSETVSDLIEHGASVAPQPTPAPPQADPLADTVDAIIEQSEAETPPEPKPLSDMEAMRADLAALRTQMEQLQETLVILYDKVLKDLEEENEALKREVQRLHARQSGLDPALMPHVPRPDSEIIENALREQLPPEEAWVNYPEESLPVPEEAAPSEEAMVVPDVIPPSGNGPLNYQIIEEWGRSPEVAAELGEEVSSLKGMVCVVPQGVEPAALKELGRTLHAQFIHYDNINIDVFDNKEAAQNYAQTNVPDTAHQVLSVSKHRASGRDVVLYYDEGTPMDVPF